MEFIKCFKNLYIHMVKMNDEPGLALVLNGFRDIDIDRYVEQLDEMMEVLSIWFQELIKDNKTDIIKRLIKNALDGLFPISICCFISIAINYKTIWFYTVKELLKRTDIEPYYIYESDAFYYTEGFDDTFKKVEYIYNMGFNLKDCYMFNEDVDGDYINSMLKKLII